MGKTVGIVLAGGLSRRYGKPKAFEQLDGKQFYQIAYEALASVCHEVVIVTREAFSDWFPPFYHVIVDIEAYSGCGPLAGIYSGMLAMEAETYIILPCDMPFIHANIVRQLMEHHQKNVTIVNVDGQKQPLVSVWDHSVKVFINRALENEQYAMKHFLKTVEVHEVSSVSIANDNRLFININTADERREMTKWRRL